MTQPGPARAPGTFCSQLHDPRRELWSVMHLFALPNRFLSLWPPGPNSANTGLKNQRPTDCNRKKPKGRDSGKKVISLLYKLSLFIWHTKGINMVYVKQITYTSYTFKQKVWEMGLYSALSETERLEPVAQGPHTNKPTTF